jgi:putative ABC transport system permease protein
MIIYTATVERMREYGVLKAVGAKNRHLYSVVIIQALLSLTLGLALAISLVWLLDLTLPWLNSGINFVLTPAAVSRVGLAALFIGVIAAVAPAWQIAQLDPARVFRG